MTSKYVICAKTLVGGIGYLDAAVAAPKPIQFLSCHLSPGAEGASQTEKMASAVAQSPYPVILAGDLNAQHHEKNLEHLLKELRVWPGIAEDERKYVTFTAQNGTQKCIDYILTDKRCRIIAYHVLDAPYSDHKTVVAEINV